MAIQSGILSQIKNSIGGVTYFKNASGQVIRQRVTPVNPKTPGQMQARSLFTSAANAWAGLTNVERNTWTSYASTIFQPKKAKNNATYTGYMAFLATRMTINNALAHQRTYDVEIGGTPVALPVDHPVLLGNTAPTKKVIADFGEDVPGVKYPWFVEDIVVTDTGDWSVDLTALTGGVDIVANSGFLSSAGMRYGFQLQISRAISGGAIYVPGQNMMSLGGLPSKEWTAQGVTAGSVVNLSTTDTFNIAKYKNFPSKFSEIEATLWCVGHNGQNVKIGSKRIVVS